MVVINKVSTKKKKDDESSISYDKLGVPKVQLQADYLQNIDACDTKGDKALLQEQRKMKIEYFMLTGERRPFVLAELLGVNRHTVRKYIRQIEYRWSVCREPGLVEIKAMALSQLDVINWALWEIVDSQTKSDSIKILALTRLLKVHNQILLVHGLTPKVLENIALEEGAALEPIGSVESKIAEHKKLQGLAVKLSSHLAVEL